MPLTQDQFDQLFALIISGEPLSAEIDGYRATREKYSDLIRAAGGITTDPPDPTTEQKLGFSLARFKKEGAP